MLFHVSSTEVCDDGVAVALVGDDGQGHRVNRAMWWTDKHDTVVVLSRYVAYVSVLLDDVFDAMAFAEYVVEYKVCALTQAENSHAV